MAADGVQVDENVQFFVMESREMLEDVEPRLIELEQYTSEKGEVDEETVNLIFRLFHSLKGSAGFLQFPTVVEVTHHAETLLDLFRSGKARMAKRHTDVLCRTCDMVNALLDQIELSGSDSGLENKAQKISVELVDSINRELSGEQPEAEQVHEPDPLPRVETEPKPEPWAEADPEEETPPSGAESEEPSFELNLTDEMLDRFIQESDDQLEKVEQALLALEKDPEDRQSIEEAFRNLHSFKGNCGFVGYADMEKLSHKSESVLAAIKDGLIVADNRIVPVLLHVVDILRGSLVDVTQGGSGQVDKLSLFLDMLDDSAQIPEDAEGGKRAEILQPEAMWLLRQDDDSAPPIDIEEPLKIVPEPEAPDKEAKPAEDQPMYKARSVLRQDIRVDLTKLDQLINLVGELVIAEAMVVRNPDLVGLEMENFEKASAHLDKIVRDLQDMALSVRMIPIAGVFRKMIRLVHDLSAKFNKQVNLRLKGEDTEIDKTVAELIADPLVHLIRNAIDHGIEFPADRKAAGKDATGEILIEAKHEGGEVWIVVKDDGKGLDKKKVLEKGISRGLVQGDGSNMSEQEIFNLIFEPGFSTASQVTDVSGRGVGMDVVKKNIERMNGHVDIHSQPGVGTIFVLRIPLTLAIIEGMLVMVGQAKYTIPLLSIRESIRVRPEEITRPMDGQELVTFRGEPLPVVRLHMLHNIEPVNYELHEGLLVVVENQNESAAILVDEIVGEHQTVIKGLSNFIGKVKGVSGCTIMGDGEISLILDVGGLIKKAKETFRTQ